jgi:shikimate kinase
VSNGHLYLVGMMGAGKSTVGQVLATRLGRHFVDLDDLVAERAGWSIPAIFAAEGEEGFRAREARALADVAEEATAGRRSLVVACGGGVVLSSANREVLRSSGRVVWLRATPATLDDRVGGGEGRPLLGEIPRNTLEELSEERAVAYEAAATEIVDVDELAPDEVADAVLRALAARDVE